MPEAVPITALEIIGYANRLSETMLPSVVPPVFRMKNEASRTLLPPYTLRDGLVSDAIERSFDELLGLKEKGEVTLFDEPIVARPDYELWIDLAGVVNYEPIPTATSKLQRIAFDQIDVARQALSQGEFEQAESACRVALSADDRLMDPLAVSAAIAARKNDRGSEKLMMKLAMGHLTAMGFKYLVSGYMGQIEIPATVRDLLATHPMHGIAALRPEPQTVDVMV